MKALDKKRIDVLALRENDNLTFVQIGKAIGHRHQYAHQLYQDVLRFRRDKAENPLHGLSTRAKNVIEKAGLKSRPEIAEALKNYRLHASRDCGKGTINEIEAWLNHK